MVRKIWHKFCKNILHSLRVVTKLRQIFIKIEREPESQLKRSGSNPLQSEVNSIIHPNFAAVLNVAKPVAQLDAHSVSSTTK